MSIFRKKKNKNVTVKTISPGVQIRKIIYDSGCKDPELVAELLGLMPLSMEVAEMEEMASDERVGRLGPILPVIEMHSMIAAQISAMSYFATAMSDGEILPDEETVESLTKLFKYVAYSSAVSCITAMVDLNLIKEGYTNE